MMTKPFIVLIGLLITPHFANAQADCMRKEPYVFKGTISRVTISDSTAVTVLVPSFFALAFNFERITVDVPEFDSLTIGSLQDEMETAFYFPMGITACRDARDIVDDQFIGSKQHYKFIMRAGSTKKEVLMKIDDITFTIDEDTGRIEIELPPLII